MKALMLNLAQARDDVELTVFVGDLQQGVELAKRKFFIVIMMLLCPEAVQLSFYKKNWICP